MNVLTKVTYSLPVLTIGKLMQISPIDNIDDCVSNNKSLNVITIVPQRQSSWTYLQ